ncbi:sugar ABC transporter substrate-binding protein [Leadbettera azotonutricia]|uniref:ABC transporter n=1 Tax=Leadbettera azotonutricia (strain ATCC BAA-888 / DSM 13862 / ZAS-9) TaxID=545695 RepID=F5YBE1_LEAAZ|nr:sugar-binding protein [Leadbettera azotonutricia]AEF81217.1 ABC transporter [Leadbettera azotonutricia ZAS-9]
MKKSLVVLLALLTAASLFASGGSQSGGSSSASSGSALIGIAMPETTVLRWVKDGNSLKSEAEKRGYRAELQNGNGDQVLQNQQIGNLLTQGAKLLVVGQLNDGVASAISDAARDKVAVIAYDRIIQNSADYDYYITFNNFKVGQLQGQGLVKGMNLDAATAANPKYITYFAGSPTDGNAFFFFDGATSVLNPYIEKGVLKVVGPAPKTSKDTAEFQRIATEGWLPNIAKNRMENLLTGDARNVTLDAVLAPNDTLARAIIEACLADAKYARKLPVVSGQDAEAASLAMIKSGQQYMTVFKDTGKLAEAAIILADQILKGVANPTVPGAVLASSIGLESIGDTGKKVVKAYLLDPINITQDNWKEPITAGFITPDEVAANGLQ